MRRNIALRSLSIVGVVVLGGLILIGGTAEAAGDPLHVDLACSPTIPATGGTLSIMLTATNRTSTPKAIATSGLTAHLGNLNLLGPFVIPITVNLPPNATAVVPYISTPFPPGVALPFTFVTFGVVVMDSANKPLGSSFCLVRIQ